MYAALRKKKPIDHPAPYHPSLRIMHILLALTNLPRVSTLPPHKRLLGQEAETDDGLAVASLGIRGWGVAFDFPVNILTLHRTLSNYCGIFLPIAHVFTCNLVVDCKRATYEQKEYRANDSSMISRTDKDGAPHNCIPIFRVLAICSVSFHLFICWGPKSGKIEKKNRIIFRLHI